MNKTILWLPVLFITMLIPFVSARSDERASSEQLKQGESIFNASCMVCHANGGNVIEPRFPLRGSQKLSDFRTFLSFIRNPKMPDGSAGSMPAFPESRLSDEETKQLYNYLVYKYGIDR